MLRIGLAVAGSLLAACTMPNEDADSAETDAASAGESHCERGTDGVRCDVQSPFAWLPGWDLIVRELESDSGIVVEIAGADGTTVPLPPFPPSEMWTWCELGPVEGEIDQAPDGEDVAVIVDADGDGADDLAVMAACITGIGPTAAVPFAAGGLYLARPEAQTLAIDPAIQDRFLDLVGRRCSDAPCDPAALAQEAARP